MGVTMERLPRSLVALEIEVEEERLEASMDKAVRRLSQRVRIPGFRPGKAPRQILERTLGKPALMQEALEQLLPDLYSETLQAESIDAIGQPSFELKSTEPLVVSATVPVRPTVDIKDYQALRAPRPEVESAPDAVEESLTNLRRRYATLDPVDRSVQWGDTVRADVKVSVDGQTEEHNEEGAEFAVLQGSTVSLPGFLDHLIGLERGGPYDIEFDLPEDFPAEDLAGKKARYVVTIHEVKQEVLPELDDDFAKSLGEENLETAAQVRERIEQNVQAQLEAQAETRYQEEVLDLLMASADIDYPEVLVDHEVDRMVDQESNHASHTREQLEQWLAQIGRTEDEVREELRPRADLAVRRALVLGELGRQEGITVEEPEIQAEVDRMLEDWFPSGADMDDDQRAMLRGMLDTEETRSSIRTQLMTTSTLGRLVEIASQDEDEDGAVPRARGSRRRRGRGGTAEDAEDIEATAEAAAGDDAVSAENEAAGGPAEPVEQNDQPAAEASTQ
jgi:trigger factor